MTTHIGPAIELVLQEAEKESFRPSVGAPAPIHGAGHQPAGSRRDPTPKAPTLEELRTWTTNVHEFTFSRPDDARRYAQIVEAVMNNEAVLIHGTVEFSAEIGAVVGFAIWRQSKTADIDPVDGTTSGSRRHSTLLPNIPNKVTP